MYGDTDVMRKHVEPAARAGRRDPLAGRPAGRPGRGRHLGGPGRRLDAGAGPRARHAGSATPPTGTTTPPTPSTPTSSSSTSSRTRSPRPSAGPPRCSTTARCRGSSPRRRATRTGWRSACPASRTGLLVPTIDLGPPRPTPHDLLDGLPRRVALTLPELRFAADRANGAPLPFDLRAGARRRRARRPARRQPRLGGAGGVRRGARPAARPARSLSRRGLLVGGPDDGVVDEGLLGALGLLATPDVAVDLDVAAGPVQAKSWHRQSGGAVAALSTQDGLVFELAWFPTWAWPAELARAPVVPEDLPLHDSVVPDLRRPPARAGRRRDRGRPHPPHRPRRRAGGPPPRCGHRRRRPRAAPTARWPGADRPGHRGAGPAARLVADVSGAEPTTVGSWPGRWSPTGGGRCGPMTATASRLEVARVIPEDLAAELAPVLAEVAR